MGIFGFGKKDKVLDLTKRKEVRVRPEGSSDVVDVSEQSSESSDSVSALVFLGGLAGSGSSSS